LGAFNTVQVHGQCPAHGGPALISVQTHVASSFEGDAAGRFHDRNYQLGQGMRWWLPEDPRYAEWRVESRKIPPSHARRSCQEACYAVCTDCRAELCVVLEFENLTPLAAVFVGLERDWPAEHWK
jgi:hypothetical protein